MTYLKADEIRYPGEFLYAQIDWKSFGRLTVRKGGVYIPFGVLENEEGKRMVLVEGHNFTDVNGDFHHVAYPLSVFRYFPFGPN